MSKPGTLAGDAPTYLAAVASMPSYQTRALYVRRWCDALGPVSRKKLTAIEVRTQLQVWATCHASAAAAGRFLARPPLKVETTPASPEGAAAPVHRARREGRPEPGP